MLFWAVTQQTSSHQFGGISGELGVVLDISAFFVGFRENVLSGGRE